MKHRIGSLFSGAGGLDIAVEHVLGGETVWHCEIEPAAALVLDLHWPGVPNLGDIREVRFSQRRAEVEPVDVLSLGFPCQDVSQAGLRGGMSTGTRSGLWKEAARAIGLLRPAIVVVENVRGLLTIDAGEGLKGIDVVIADLEGLGYGVAWTLVTAASIGAPHRRERVFIVAQLGVRSRGRVAAPTGPDTLLLLPTPMARDGKGGKRPTSREGGDNLPMTVRRLLPTPSTSDGNGIGEQGKGTNLRTEVVRRVLPTPRASRCQTETLRRLLPTPQARDGAGAKVPELVARADPSRGAPANLNDYAVHRLPWPGWGEYAAAVEHWERLTAAAPAPVEPSTTGGIRLAAEFSEWMMGWPGGWVTALLNKNPRRRVPGRFGYGAAHKIIGNGVVAHQAAAAIDLLLG